MDLIVVGVVAAVDPQWELRCRFQVRRVVQRLVPAPVTPMNAHDAVTPADRHGGQVRVDVDAAAVGDRIHRVLIRRDPNVEVAGQGGSRCTNPAAASSAAG